MVRCYENALGNDSTFLTPGWAPPTRITTQTNPSMKTVITNLKGGVGRAIIPQNLAVCPKT